MRGTWGGGLRGAHVCGVVGEDAALDRQRGSNRCPRTRSDIEVDPVVVVVDPDGPAGALHGLG